MRRQTIILVSIVIVMVHLFSGCDSGKATESNPKPKKIPFVSIQQSRVQKMVSSITITGTVGANVFSEVVSPVDGVIENLYARENQSVKKGNIIAVINPNERVSLIANNRLKVEQLQKQLSGHSTNSKEYANIKQQLDDAKKNLEYAQNMYQANPVVCPANGLVTQRWLDEGAQVNVKDKILKITDMSSLVIKAEVNEQYYEAIQKGKQFPLKLNAYPNNSLTGIVSLVYPQISPQTRSVLFDIKVKNFNKKLLPGMMAVIGIPVFTVEKAVVVNTDAVLSSPDNKQFLFVVNKDGIAQKRIVETGISLGRLLEIKQGINSNEDIVVKGQEMLKDGMKVKIIGTPENR